LLVVSLGVCQAARAQQSAAPSAPATDVTPSPGEPLRSDASLALPTTPAAVDETPAARPEPARSSGTGVRLVGSGVDLAALEERLQVVLGDRLVRESADPVRLYRFSAASGRSIILIFDARRDGVLVEGPVGLLDQIERLVDALAASEANAGRRTAVVAIERTDRARLKQAVDAYRNQRGAEPRLRDGASRIPADVDTGGLALVNFVMQDGDGESAAATAGRPTGDATDAADSRDEEDKGATTPGGLDVDVDVQTLPDLDVIILRGRDRDVSKLTEIIQELERLSRETQPQVQVYTLEHAQSAAVVEVLKTVTEDLTGRRQGRVTATALVKPNAILLIGWGEAVQAMVELIKQLDTPVEPASQFRVFRLEHAPAATLVATINEFFATRTGLAARARVVADARSNSLIVSASPRDLEEVDRLVKSLDTDESSAVNRAKVLTLKHALAADVAATLRTALQPTNGTGATSGILELMTVDADGERLIRSGILADLKITVNARNNSLILSGPSESFPLLEALVEQLDAPGAVSQIKVFRILNGDASSMVRMLRSLLPSETGASQGPQLPAAEGETTLAPLRFSVDTRTNSIIATGSDGDLRIIEALLLRLDERDLAERKNEVYRLKNAPALDVATAINEFLRSERIVQLASPGSESPFEQIEREVVVVPEPVGNSLIISATPRFFDEIRELVIELDEQPPQVLIQVLIAEVALGDVHEFGIEAGLQDSILFDRSLLGDLVTTVRTTQTSTPAGIVTTTEEIVQAATNQPGFNFNNNTLGNSGSNRALERSSNVGGQGMTHFSVGRTNSELGFGGLVLSASSESVSVLVRALQESRRLDVLSRPQVRTLDNQPAFIQVGQRVPRIVASNLTQGGLQTNSVELENVGLIMGVTPRISPDGTVVMEIDAEKSSLGPESEGIPITVSLDGTIIRAPRIDTTTAQATVSAASGETIILGGLITNSTQNIARRVPYLSDIPVLGNLFRYDGTANKRTELLIILTPHVIRSSRDSERINQMEMARMSWCTADVYRVHGDLPAGPHTGPVFDQETQIIYPHDNPRGETTPAEPTAESTEPVEALDAARPEAPSPETRSPEAPEPERVAPELFDPEPPEPPKPGLGARDAKSAARRVSWWREDEESPSQERRTDATKDQVVNDTKDPKSAERRRASRLQEDRR
jgi:type II secretion system protein D